MADSILSQTLKELLATMDQPPRRHGASQALHSHTRRDRLEASRDRASPARPAETRQQGRVQPALG